LPVHCSTNVHIIAVAKGVGNIGPVPFYFQGDFDKSYDIVFQEFIKE
jgi:hypothetical protein